MPSEYSPADRSERATFPRAVERTGEDPARWLDCPLPEIPDQGEVVMAYDRIASIEKLGVINTWRLVEQKLGRGEDGGPREHVMQRLDERLQEIVEGGERDDERNAEIAAAVRAERGWDGPLDVDLPSRDDRLASGTLGVGTDRYQRDDEGQATTEASGLDDWAVAADGGEGE